MEMQPKEYRIKSKALETLERLESNPARDIRIKRWLNQATDITPETAVAEVATLRGAFFALSFLEEESPRCRQWLIDALENILSLVKEVLSKRGVAV